MTRTPISLYCINCVLPANEACIIPGGIRSEPWVSQRVLTSTLIERAEHSATRVAREDQRTSGSGRRRQPAEKKTWKSRVKRFSELGAVMANSLIDGIAE